jgi:hypothetical protein
MGIVCWGTLQYSRFDSIELFGPRLLVFIGLIMSAMLTYLGIAWALRCNEISEVYGIAFPSAGREPRRPGIAG